MVIKMPQKYHLAQLNIADAKADSTSEVMQGFFSRITEIHNLAEGSPGYVWRYDDEEGADVAERVFGNPLMLINMTLWEDIDSLRHFVYKSIHKELIQGREAWFNKMPEMYQVMWWVPVGHIPSIQEAKDKLELLRKHGPTAEAFTFAKKFDPS